MLQGHTFHSFVRNDLRDKGPYVLSQFAGGLAPAIFLFLTGVTMAFRMDSDERRGLTPLARVLSALKRARYLLNHCVPVPAAAVGVFFAVESAVGDVESGHFELHGAGRSRAFGDGGVPDGGAGAALRGLGVGGCRGVAADFPTRLVRHSSAAEELHRAGLSVLQLLPLGRFLCFRRSARAASSGLLKDEQMDRAMQWAALLGAGLIVGGRYFGDLPYSIYPKTEYWLDSPAMTLIKLGVVLWILPFAFLWTR